MFTTDISDKQHELLKKLDIGPTGLEVRVNELPKPGSTCILDVEHDELGNFVCCGILPVQSDVVYEIFDSQYLKRLDCDVIGHNVKTDVELLRQWGAPLDETRIVHDTYLYAHILDSSLPEFGLKYLSRLHLGIEYPSYDDIVGKRTKKQKHERITLDKQPQELVRRYNVWDCFATRRLYEWQQCRLGAKEKDYFLFCEKPVSSVFSGMETRGLRIDRVYLGSVKEQLVQQIEPMEKEILDSLGDINLESPKQLLDALKKKGITPIWRAKESTDKRALENVKGHPIVQKLLQYRELETLLSSFVNPYLERNTEFVYPHFSQTGTRTGRPSCKNPNLLQIPKRTENGKLVRKMFIPRDGMRFGDCDFGQIEPRVLAHLSGDAVLCDMFNKGVDFHEFTARSLDISRERAKVLNLSVGYRATWKSVMQQLKCSREEAQEEINKWWLLFPTLRRYQDRLIWEARKSGYCTTLLGRRIKVDGLESQNMWQREAAERQLVNNIAQGSAAEIMKLAMIGIERSSFSPTFGLLVQVYDELLAESADMENDIEQMKFCMENCVKLNVPLVCDSKIGLNWGELE